MSKNFTVHEGAKIAEDVEIGPYSVIGKDVVVGRGTKVHNNVTIIGPTTIGEENVIFPGVVIGAPPQDTSYKAEDTKIIIGNGNIIRECVTINRASTKENWTTRIGDNNFLMASSHIAHDCILEDNIVMANGVLLGGHVRVERNANFGGFVAVHHFVTVGRFSFVGGATRIVQDVPPFMIVQGIPSKIHGVNLIGLERARFSQGAIDILKKAFKVIFREELNKEKAYERLEKEGLLTNEVQYLIKFSKEMEKGKFGRAREILRK